MKKSFLVIGFIIVFVVAFIWSLPAPIDNDLSQIGNGKKSVVFIYDLNRVVSNEQTIEINKAQLELGEAVNYLVSRTGYPATDDLIKNYRAQSAELLFFDEQGELFERKFALLDSKGIMMILASSR